MTDQQEGRETDFELLPVRMVVQYTFCPRLFYLEWVDGEFRHNKFTLDGKRVHKSSDKESTKKDSEKEVLETTSVYLSSHAEKLTGRIDLLEESDDRVVPVEVKRGKSPPDEPWLDHKVQLCAYALLLEDNGYGPIKYGEMYYAESNKRVPVRITEQLKVLTRENIRNALAASLKENPPPPLQDSRKCMGCSLSPVCLPDEYWALKDFGPQGTSLQRRVIPARDDCIPLYVQDQGATIKKTRNCLKVISGQEKPDEVRLYQTSQVNLMGNVQMTTQSVHSCLNNDVPILYFTSSGYFLGYTVPLSTRSSRLKIAQYRSTLNSERIKHISSVTVAAKIQNSRTMLRRNADEVSKSELTALSGLSDKASKCEHTESLLGIEGAAARNYFGNFQKMLNEDINFVFNSRNRRPPRDPINAMLSYSYGMLVKDCTIVLQTVGLDPCLGFYHKQRPGRPSLALDLMEPFRSIISDSAVLYAVNKHVVKASDFITRETSVTMKPAARKGIIRSYERRMDQLVTHPMFDYRVSYRRILEIQARLLARYLTDEIDSFTCFTTR